ncbi:MAG: phosphopantetheine-binding protein [Treponema sp.]|nr:phosphopantetheine-binding protein [Treponema sp.]
MTIEELYGILEKVTGNPQVRNNIDLIEHNILDSLAFIELLNELEDRGIVIHPTQVDIKNFSTAEQILNMISKSGQ